MKGSHGLPLPSLLRDNGTGLLSEYLVPKDVSARIAFWVSYILAHISEGPDPPCGSKKQWQ